MSRQMPAVFQQFTELPQTVKRPFSVASILTAIITLASFTAVLIIQPEIPLFNSMPSGYVLANRYWILLFPALALSITLVHLCLSWLGRKFQPMVLQLFAWMTVVLLLLLTIVLTRLLLLVL